MIRFSHRVVATLIAFPLAVAAQTANQPGGQASTGTPLDQTTNSPGASTPKTTRTSPDATNPSGALPANIAKDYGTSKASSTPSSSTTPSATGKTRATTKANTAKTGDLPSYPAPAPDGTPTR